MKAIPFVCLWLLLSTVAVLHLNATQQNVVFIQALTDPLKVRPAVDAGNPDCSATRKKQEIIWSTCSKPFYISGHPVTCIEVGGGRSECRVYSPLELLELRRKARKARIEQWKLANMQGNSG